MTNLIKTEWLKIKNYRAFWWMLGIVALTYPGINYIFHFFYKEQLKDERMGAVLSIIANPFTFPDIWQTVAYLSSWFIFIPAVLVIMFITNEYTYKTHRQNIIDGWSRSQFMLSKMIDVLMIAFFITLLYTIVTIAIGYANMGGSDVNIWDNSKYIFLFLLQSFSQLSIAFLIAFLVRKAFIALAIFLFEFLILENFLVAYLSNRANDEGRFLPLEISDRLIPLPRFMVENSDKWESLMQQANNHLIYTGILLVITWGFCFWLNKKRDL